MQGPEPSKPQVTRLLKAWNGGDASALEQLTPIVYLELRRLARNSMRAERPGHLLQPSALVNEAFVRLMSGAPVEWQDRAHFFGFAARLMRQILVDFARAKSAAKRGHSPAQLDLSSVDEPTAMPSGVNLIDVDLALQELAKLHPRQANVVELRFFGGLENLEIATCLGISDDTVGRDWRIARAWLYERLGRGW